MTEIKKEIVAHPRILVDMDTRPNPENPELVDVKLTLLITELPPVIAEAVRQSVNSKAMVEKLSFAAFSALEGTEVDVKEVYEGHGSKNQILN